MADITCLYCEKWIESSIISRDQDQEEGLPGEKTKKKRRRVASGSITRICKTRQREITSSNLSCKYFKPTSYIYCRRNNQKVPMITCLHKRLNPKKFSEYKKCRRCRQFSKEIQPILEEYHITAKRIIEPKIGKILKRRKGHEAEKRVLKRRNDKKQKQEKTEFKQIKIRKLKRRDEQPKKLKRRR
jgi:hypothetical protein